MKRLIIFSFILIPSLLAFAIKIDRTNIQIEINSTTIYTKGNFERPIYGSCTYYFDDVKQVGDFDMTPFHNALCKRYEWPLNSTPQSLFDTWIKGLLDENEGAMIIVPNKGKTISYDEWYNGRDYDEKDVYGFSMPYNYNSLQYLRYNSELQIITLQFSWSVYLGGGGGASFFGANTYFNYSFQLGREIKLSDILKPGYKTTLTNILREYLKKNAEELCLQADPDSVDLSDNWSLEDQNLNFYYQKYEIACGAAGFVSIPLYPYLFEEYLTPLGKKIFISEE